MRTSAVVCALLLACSLAAAQHGSAAPNVDEGRSDSGSSSGSMVESRGSSPVSSGSSFDYSSSDNSSASSNTSSDSSQVSGSSANSTRSGSRTDVKTFRTSLNGPEPLAKKMCAKNDKDCGQHVCWGVPVDKDTHCSEVAYYQRMQSRPCNADEPLSGTACMPHFQSPRCATPEDIKAATDREFQIARDATAACLTDASGLACRSLVKRRDAALREVVLLGAETCR